MICRKCGKYNNDEAVNCQYCGELLEDPSDQSSTVVIANDSSFEYETQKELLNSSYNAKGEQSPEDEKIAVLRKYKELLDEGVITEDDYNKKKDEIINGSSSVGGVLSSFTKKIQNEKSKLAEQKGNDVNQKSEEEIIYEKAVKAAETKTVESYKKSIELFISINNFKDSEQRKEALENELPQMEKEEAEAIEKANQIKKEKSKKLKKKLKICAAVLLVVIVAVGAISMINDASKPDFDSDMDMTNKTIHNISYSVPDKWKERTEDCTDVLQRYIRKDDGKIIGVLDVEYKGEDDLDGDAAYDDSHKAPDEISDYIKDAKGIYQTVDAAPSKFEVTVYYKKDEVKGEEDFLDTIAGSFDVDNYENPVELKKVKVKYDGSTKAGTIIDEDNEGLIVKGVYDTGVAKGTAVPKHTVKPVTLKSGKTSVVKVKVDNKTYKIKVGCTTMSKAQYKAKCKYIGYKSQLRKPNYGSFIKISGKVLQDAGDGYYRISSNGDWDDVYMVETDANIVEDDYVTVYGKTSGIYEYETVMGNSQKVPWIDAKYVER